MGYNLLVNGVYWGYNLLTNHLLTSWDIQVCHQCRLRIDFIQQNGLQVEWILETHAHADHLSAAPYIQEKLGGKIAIGENIRLVQDVFAGVFNLGPDFQRDGSQFDKLFADGESFRIGELTASVMYTPGHTPACVCYLAIRLDHLWVFCGVT